MEDIAAVQCETPSVVSSFPTEVLLNILEYLPARQLYRCRRVCVRWKEIIDHLENPKYWREKCQEDHDGVYKAARLKSHPTLPWRSLYKSLSLWSKLKWAKEKWSVVECEVNGRDIHNVHAWKGTAAVHKLDSIVYYNLETLKPTNNINIGKYLTFEENEDMMAYMHYTEPRMSWFRQLRVVPKVEGKPQFDKTVKVDNVNNFVIFNEDIYYNRWSHDPDSSWKVISEMFLCKLKQNFECSFLARLNKSPWGFSSSGKHLHFLTSNEIIYSLIDHDFVLTEDVRDKETCFSKLLIFSLAENANFPEWLMDCHGIVRRIDYIPDCTLRIYGDIVVTGSSAGILRIYHGPALCLDEKTAPIKEYDLKTQFDLTEPEIKGIDLMEIDSGHIIIVCTQSKIMALTLYHD